MSDTLIIWPPHGETTSRELEQAIIDRYDAKMAKDYAKSDSIRDKLLAEGIILRDVQNSVYWTRAHVQERGGVPEPWKDFFSPLYKKFCVDQHLYDWSDEALLVAYRWETRGEEDESLGGGIFDGSKNGYVAGKKWLGVQITMWIEDINDGILTKNELYEEMPEYKDWLKNVLSSAFMLDNSWKKTLYDRV